MRALGTAIILIAMGACGGDEPGGVAAQGKGDGDLAVCVTQLGVCPLTEARERTDRCECSSPWGPIEGYASGGERPAVVHCTAHQFCEFRKDGKPEDAVRQLCCSRDSWRSRDCETPLRAALADESCAPDPTLDAKYCFTSAGVCPLTEARKRTDRCECSSPWGPIEGYAS